MGCAFYFTRPGRRFKSGGRVKMPYRTKLPAGCFEMGYGEYMMMRFRLFSLFNVRFGLVWYVWLTLCHGNDSGMYAGDVEMMRGIQRYIPLDLCPVAEQGDTDGALTAKEVERLALLLRSPGIDLRAEIPEYRIALPKEKAPLEYGAAANYIRPAEKPWSPDTHKGDVNCLTAREAVERYARLVREAARLGFGLQW